MSVVVMLCAAAVLALCVWALLGALVRRGNAVLRAPGLSDVWMRTLGMPVVVSKLVPAGKAFIVQGQIIVNPDTRDAILRFTTVGSIEGVGQTKATPG